MYRAALQPIWIALGTLLAMPSVGWAQPASGPPVTNHGLRLAQQNNLPSTSAPVMVPLSSGGAPSFDPYAPTTSAFSGSGGMSNSALPLPASALTYSPSAYGFPTAAPGMPGAIAPGAIAPGGMAPGVYPSYTGPGPILPGAGQSAIVQTNPTWGPNAYSPPGVYPNSTPSALFPGSYDYSGGSGGLFQNWFGNSASPNFGGSSPGWGGYGTPGFNPGMTSPMSPNSGWSWNNGAWNPSGTMFSGQMGQAPSFIRLFQGPRIRHAYIHGDGRHNALAINDTDLAVALVFPNFAFSTQPIYVLPSFSLHQWSGPRDELDPDNNADMPNIAFSAFLDTGWQSDPARIFGAELGVRVGMFSDFDAVSTNSLRIMGRGIGRVRLTPQATVKLGVMYLDRNRVKVLPAGGILWQPNPATRLDLFFPEPKLSSYLTTLGNVDTWWYVAGYYGGGNWTVRREDGTKDRVDINDIRIVLGLEWGRNEMMRDGRRVGFLEFGYVFDRELIYRQQPADNLDLQDNFVIRAGIGY